MEELVRRAKGGDGGAFVELMEGQKSTLYKVARSYLHNDADAADAVSETVLACFEKLDTLRQPRYFRTWLVRICIRKCQDLLRERKRSVPLDELTEVGRDEPGHARVEFLALLDSREEKRPGHGIEGGDGQDPSQTGPDRVQAGLRGGIGGSDHG